MYMNSSSFVVFLDFFVARAYGVFFLFVLCYFIVVDDDYVVCGVIICKDLIGLNV